MTARFSHGFILAFHDIKPNRLAYLVDSIQPARAVSLSEMVERTKNRKSTSGLFAITVDDGVGETVKSLAPLFIQRGWPASFYICVDYVESKQPLPFQWWREIVTHLQPEKLELKSGTLDLSRRGAIDALNKQMQALWHSSRPDHYLPLIRELAHVVTQQFGPDALRPPQSITWEEVSKFATNDLIRFESHGLSHVAMSSLTDAELVIEMKHSRDSIREHTGGECRHFAYPFGSDVSIGKRAPVIASAHYDSAVTMKLGNVDCSNPWLLPRIPLYPSNSRLFANLKILLKCGAGFGRLSQDNPGWHQGISAPVVEESSERIFR